MSNESATPQFLTPPLNSILARWMDAAAFTTAVDCNRCSHAELHLSSAARWRDFKCCTFQPFVSNFSLGAMLEAGMNPLALDPTKVRATALGILPTAHFRNRHQGVEPNDLGELHLCNYYDREKRRCKIWKFRPGECSTYTCSAIDAARRESNSQKAFAMEVGVAQMAMVHLGFSGAEVAQNIEELNAPSTSGRGLTVDESRELYLRAWHWAQGLQGSEVRSWLDSEPAGG